jgi:2-aminoadipate transaminase
MRLNFSGVGEADIREGVRRIGEVVREQVQLYDTLTGTHRAVAPPAEPAPAEFDAELADVLHLPPAAGGSGIRRRAGGSGPRQG